MKQLYKTSASLAFLAALLASACTTSVVDEPDTDARAISFQPPQAETRAAVDGTSLPTGSSFKVWGGYDNSAINVFNGETVTETSGTWNYTGGTRYWLTGKTYNFYAVYPANLPTGTTASVATDGTITVTDFDASATGADAVDLMTAEATGISYAESETPQPVGMTFGHTLTRLTFSAKLADGLGDGYSLQVQQIALWASNKGNLTQTAGGTPQWETQPYLTGGDESPVQNPDYNAYLYQLTVTDGELANMTITPATGAAVLNTDDKGDLLVIPQTMSETRPVLAIQYALGYNGTYASPTWKTYYLRDNSTNWTPGASLNYLFTVNEDNVYFSINVSDWTAGNSGNEDIDFE